MEQQQLQEEARAAFKRGDYAEAKRVHALILEEIMSKTSPETQESWRKKKEERGAP
jgi:hypothetical protein